MYNIGDKINELTIIGFMVKNKRRYAKCLCSCGNECFIRVDSLKRGQKSCGCRYRKWHGRSSHRLYSIWCKMKDRCYNNSNAAYKYYGGKGIFLSEEFLDYNMFYKWAMDNGYDKNKEIDRIDNSKPYSRDNCKFSTRREQMINTTRSTEYPGVCYAKDRNSYNAYIFFKGKQKTKRFYIDKLGKERALEMAINERKKMEAEVRSKI